MQTSPTASEVRSRCLKKYSYVATTVAQFQLKCGGADIADSAINVFDREALRQRRDRVASTFGDHDFLKTIAADAIVDRLSEIKRPFERVLDLGCHRGELSLKLGPREMLVATDLSSSMMSEVSSDALKLICDEEALPFRDSSFDLVTSALTLHWVNDLPGALVQANRLLTPGWSSADRHDRR